MHSHIVYVQVVEALDLVFAEAGVVAMLTVGDARRRAVPGGGAAPAARRRRVRLEEFGVAAGGVVVPPGERVRGGQTLDGAVVVHGGALVGDDVLRVVEHRDLPHLVRWKRRTRHTVSHRGFSQI